MKRFFFERKLNVIYSIAAIILMWLVWITAYYIVGNRLIVPNFLDTMKEFFRLLSNGDFWTALWNTILRTLVAFLISFALAAGCAAVSAFGSALRAVLRPIIGFIRILPTLAIILIILVWTEDDRNIAPVIVTALVLFPMIYAQFMAAIDDIDGGIRQMVKVYGISGKKAVFKIYLPMILPNILSQSGANISLGLKIMISGEVLAGTLKGLGAMMQYASMGALIARLAALTLMAVIFGLIIDIALSQLARITYKWSRKEGAR